MWCSVAGVGTACSVTPALVSPASALHTAPIPAILECELHVSQIPERALDLQPDEFDAPEVTMFIGLCLKSLNRLSTESTVTMIKQTFHTHFFTQKNELVLNVCEKLAEKFEQHK